MKVANLIKIDVNANNNRVYIMTDLGNGTFQVEYGRMGSSLLKRKFPSQFWEDVRQKHLAEGYIDRTEEFALSAKIKDGEKYDEIPEKSVRDFVNFLLSCSKHVVKDNYTVEYEEVSPHMISAAQDTIFRISQASEINVMRELYRNLFIIIPRKMKTVTDWLPLSIPQGLEMLEREQSLLDALKSVNISPPEASTGRTILDATGLKIRVVTDKELEQIKKYLTPESAGLAKRAFRVENIRTEEQFNLWCKTHGCREKDIHFLYHGSQNENYWGIATTGLLLNPKAPITGKMFGYGIYFAPRAKKSIGYTSLSGSYWKKGTSSKAYLAVFKVAYKNPDHTQTCNGYHGIKKAPHGHDAVYAHAGTQLYNDEVIVYNEAQCTLQYLVELGK